MEDKRIQRLIEIFCLKDSLECHDPYDVWMTGLGIRVKQWYNTNAIMGIMPAAALTIWDQFVNNSMRLGYDQQEYPTVRAMAALTLLNLYERVPDQEYVTYAQKHIEWLLRNSCKGYSGLCWGLGFKWAAGDGLDYDENTPFTTHTPYVLEALHRFVELTGDRTYVRPIKSIFEFYENDVQTMYEDEECLATSYGPDKDRLVTNAVSYTLYAYTIFLKYLPEKEPELKGKISKLYTFIRKKQRQDGSWLYESENPNSFIDCFHSCFILKNLHKADRTTPLPGCADVVHSGYEYVKANFQTGQHRLFKRFTLRNKPSIVKFDLYDNAEMLHLAILLEDTDLISVLDAAVDNQFVENETIYSVIDLFNGKRNKNTLRWAVMPYLYALSAFRSS